MTGGRGVLGTEIVRRLEARGITVTSASRRTGVDLATGEGLEAALHGAECVVHAATHRLRYRRVDLDGTQKMIKILAGWSTPPHLIYVSIVGCDRIPQQYYRVKSACELVLERSKLPVTVVRATQFHTLITEIASTVTIGPLAFVPRGMSFQPCDHRWIAADVADLALAPAPSGYQRAADRAGPGRVGL
ncbi:MAG: SDR family oxidoreductase, partial [Propionibacteriaceae bacterium]